MPRIYLAGPLFSEAEQDWLLIFKRELQISGYDVLWPFELFNQDEIDRLTAKDIMEGCRKALDDCDLVVALLDGTQVDDGTSWEIGYAYARDIPIYGIRTDTRNGGELPGGKVNAMIAGSCKLIASSRQELILALPAVPNLDQSGMKVADKAK